MTFKKLPARYKAGFWAGGLSLTAAIVLRISSGSAQTNVSLQEAPSIMSAGAFTRGATLTSVLSKVLLPPAEIHRVAQALKGVLDPRSLRADDRYEINGSSAGAFSRLTITRDLKRYVVETTPGAYAAYTEDIPLSLEEKTGAGVIKGSLWESMRDRGLDAALIMEFADVFAWDIDFLTEPRAGDRYALQWKEKKTPEGKVVEQKVMAALYDGEYTGRQEAVFFGGDYFAPDGKSRRRAFLRAPLAFRRISSGFSRRRLHPILRIFRPHWGIDYAAPRGTPVVSVGDGTVIFKGWKTAYGNWIKVRHNGSYVTCYGHLSRYAKGLRTGSRVKQGQVIGYVGATGWATGPHLDFRVIKNGSFVNFLKLKFPSEKSVPRSQRAAFAASSQKLLSRLDSLLNQQQ